MTGQIVSITAGRFGFIRPDEKGKDIFLHHSELIDLVWDDSLLHQRVQFELQDSPKGPRAINVRPLN